MKIGSHMSEDAKLKISKAKKGKHLSNEIKKKIRDSLLGTKNPFYGKHHSEETRNKIRVASKGRKSANKGKHIYNNGKIERYFFDVDKIPPEFVRGRLKFSAETKLKMSKAATGKNNSMYGKKIPDEVVKERTRKIINTKLLNKTFNTSKDSEEVFKNFLIKFIGVNNFKQQYIDKQRYPFLCDFYIPKLDLFIELNHFKSHNGHLFNKNNEADLKELQLLEEKAKSSKFYKKMITVWTMTDPLKFETAQKNNLNYMVSYNIDEMQNMMKKLIKLFKLSYNIINKEDFE